VVDELVGAGLRSLARKYHPDTTGSDGRHMAKLNATADWLRSAARGLS
jgi:hypothetical protein